MDASPLVLKVAVDVLRITGAAFIRVNPIIVYVSKNSGTGQSKSHLKYLQKFSLANFHISVLTQI